jgi:hypothetical protein
LIGHRRLQYPSGHIEVDNRLSWFLGRLDKKYGDEAFYVHLKRNRNAVASSFEKRYGGGIIRAYAENILMGLPQEHDPRSVCLDYYDTVNQNIELFLEDKSQKIKFELENAREDFEVFWNRIQATGDLSAALEEWSTQYNSSRNPKEETGPPLIVRAGKKIKRIVKGLPEYVMDA